MNGMKERINVGIFIPVRLSSKRFPAKAVYDSSFGKPLEFLIKNLSNNFINKKNIIICTSRDKIEKKLFRLARNIGCQIFKGSKNDLIDRFYNANKKFKFDYIIEVDGDDIMTDKKYIEICFNELIKNELDFVYTANLPIGMNCKVFSAKALELTQKVKISKNNSNGFMQLFYKNPFLKKKKINFKKYKNYKIRLTLDYLEDIKFFEIILFILKIKKLKNNLKNYFKIIKDNKDIIKINYFRNFDYQVNTNKMKPLKIRVGNKIKKIFIS